MVGAIIVSANLANIVLLPASAQVAGGTGMLAAAAGLAWLTRIGVHSSYAADVLPPLLLASTGLGLVMSPSMNTGTAGVASSDAGAASAMVNTGQQVGGSIGTSLLNTMAASAAASYLASHLSPRLLIGGRPAPALTATGPGAQLHHRVLVGRRNVRWRIRARRPALPPRCARRTGHRRGLDTELARRGHLRAGLGRRGFARAARSARASTRSTAATPSWIIRHSRMAAVEAGPGQRAEKDGTDRGHADRAGQLLSRVQDAGGRADFMVPDRGQDEVEQRRDEHANAGTEQKLGADELG